MREPLSDTDCEAALKALPGWAREEDRLVKTFTFPGFREAVAFIVRLAFEAEQLNHHPELYNVYNRVKVALTTHDAGNRITAMDLKLAHAIEQLT